MVDIQNVISKLAENLKPDVVDFCQRLIQVPALSGDEKRGRRPLSGRNGETGF